MSNNVQPIVSNKQLEVLRLIEAKQLTVEEGMQYLQSGQHPLTPEATTPKPPMQAQPSQPNAISPAKVLRVKVIDGANTKVSVALPLSLVKWTARTLKTTLNTIAPAILPHALAKLAKQLNPDAASSSQSNLEEMDFDALCNVIVEGLDEIEDIGQFDFVTVEDGDTKVQIGIE